MGLMQLTLPGVINMDANDTFNKIQSGEVDIDQLLNPGKYLHQADPKSLEIEVLPSGFETFDKPFMLLKKNEGELIVVAGEPSMGKSALMLQVAFNVSKTDPVHIFSLEDSYESIVRRRVAAIINRGIDAIQLGLCRNLVAPALQELTKYNYFVDDRGGLTVDEICDRARNHHRKNGTKLIAIDHLQILGMNPGHSRALEIGKATSQLKSLAKELKCPILLASQLNRQYAGREDRRPRLSDLKESSSIEADADIVISVYREVRYTGLRQNEADIGILKNRNGPVGDIVMGFSPAQANFSDTGNNDI